MGAKYITFDEWIKYLEEITNYILSVIIENKVVRCCDEIYDFVEWK